MKKLTKFSEKKLFEETEKEILDFINSLDMNFQKYKDQARSLLNDLKLIESTQTNSNENVFLLSKEVYLFIILIILLVTFSFLILKKFLLRRVLKN